LHSVVGPQAKSVELVREETKRLSVGDDTLRREWIREIVDVSETCAVRAHSNVQMLYSDLT